MYTVKFKLITGNIIHRFSVLLSSYNQRNSDFFIPRFNTVQYGKHSPVLYLRLFVNLRLLIRLYTIFNIIIIN